MTYCYFYRSTQQHRYKSRYDTTFFQRSYTSGSSHGMTPNALQKFEPYNNAPSQE
ncbi:hypothetical protein [Rickettsia endosymbiont of Polydrusus tereticollis]|uniref:hypothetical protein n=1 Tax=Rickettsia endosymbiont of Polydrusus tereticollis TaxID=3066251 RepID=UPI003132A12C